MTSSTLPYLLLATCLLNLATMPRLKAQGSRKADSVRVVALLEQADNEFVQGTFGNTLSLAQHALALSLRYKFPRNEALSRLKIATVYAKQDTGEEVMPLLDQAIRIGTQLRDSFVLALGYYQKGQELMYADQLDEAEALFNRALDLNFNKLSSGHKGQVYNDLGYLYGRRSDYRTQAQWLLKAIRVHEQLDDKLELAVSLGNLAGVYHNMGNREEAINYTKQAIALKENFGNVEGLALSYGNLANLFAIVSLDSALYYQQKATASAEKNNLRSALVQCYTNMSLIYDQKAGKGDRDLNKKLALEHILKAIELCESMNDELVSANKIRWAAQLYGDLNDTARMEEYYIRATAIARRAADKTILRDIYGARATSYTRKKNFEQALSSLKDYYRYRDSVVAENTATGIAELRTKYETEKKDNQILRLETEQRLKQLSIEKQKAEIAGNKLEAERKEGEIRLLSKQQELRDIRIRQQEEQLDKQLLLGRNNQQALLLAEQEKKIADGRIADQRTQRNLMLVGVLLLLVTALFLFNRYQLKKKLQQQRVLLTVRNNIARDLHDEIGSTLTSIRILSQVSYNNLEKDQQKSSRMLRQITEQSEQMQQGMSDIVWAIAPQNDRLENMMIRMREFVRDTLEPKNILTEFQVEEQALQENIGMAQRRDFYMVFKEAVNNISKYSQATEVTIFLGLARGKVILRICDNGRGFDPLAVRSSQGLKNMQARAQAMHGVVKIESSPGNGSSVQLEIPAT